MTAPAGTPATGFRWWYAAFAGIAWWMVHITFVAASARFLCEHQDLRWTLHVATLVTAAGTALAIRWSVERWRRAGDDEVTDRSLDRFLGAFGALVGAISLLVILWEASYTLVISECI